MNNRIDLEKHVSSNLGVGDAGAVRRFGSLRQRGLTAAILDKQGWKVFVERVTNKAAGSST
jgi:hypothetical protein